MIFFTENLLKIFLFILLAVSSIVFIEPSPYDILMLFLTIISIPDLYRQFRSSSSKYLYALFFCLIFANILSITNAQDVILAIKYSGTTIYLMMSSLVIKKFAEKQNDAKTLITGYYVAALVTTLLGISAYLSGMHFGNINLFHDGFRVRATFKDPNVFGPFLIPPAMILLDMMVNGRIKGFAYNLLFVLFNIGILFAFSRGAWMSYALSLITYILLNIKYLKALEWTAALKTVLSTILICGLLLTVTHKWEFFHERLGLMNYDNSRFANQIAAASGNDNYAKNIEKVNPPESKIDIIDIEKDNKNNDNAKSPTQKGVVENHRLKMHMPFIIGIGSGQFENKFPLSAHSLYVRTITENGIFGITSLLLFMGTLLYKLFQNRSVNSSYLNPKVIFALLIGTGVNSIVIDTIHWRHFWLLIGLAWAIVDCPVNKSVNESE